MVFPDLAENLTVSGLQVQAAPKTQLSWLLQSSLFSWLLLSGTFLQLLPKPLPDPGFPSTFLASISLHKVSICIYLFVACFRTPFIALDASMTVASFMLYFSFVFFVSFHSYHLVSMFSFLASIPINYQLPVETRQPTCLLTLWKVWSLVVSLWKAVVLVVWLQSARRTSSRNCGLIVSKDLFFKEVGTCPSATSIRGQGLVCKPTW